MRDDDQRLVLSSQTRQRIDREGGAGARRPNRLGVGAPTLQQLKSARDQYPGARSELQAEGDGVRKADFAQERLDADAVGRREPRRGFARPPRIARDDAAARAHGGVAQRGGRGRRLQDPGRVVAAIPAAKLVPRDGARQVGREIGPTVTHEDDSGRGGHDS